MNNKPVIVIDECAKLRPYVPRGLSVLVLYVPRTLRALLPDVPCTLRTLVLYMLPCFVPSVFCRKLYHNFEQHSL